MAGLPPHADQQLALGSVVRAYVLWLGAGYARPTELPTRVNLGSNFTTDVRVEAGPWPASTWGGGRRWFDGGGTRRGGVALLLPGHPLTRAQLDPWWEARSTRAPLR